MSESLTNEQLDALEADLAECDPRDAVANRTMRAISMARRCLSAEERLEKFLGNPEGSSSASGEEIPHGTDAPPAEDMKYCLDCGDEHPYRDRQLQDRESHTVTLCPKCQSSSYSTVRKTSAS